MNPLPYAICIIGNNINSIKEILILALNEMKRIISRYKNNGIIQKRLNNEIGIERIYNTNKEGTTCLNLNSDLTFFNTKGL